MILKIEILLLHVAVKADSMNSNKNVKDVYIPVKPVPANMNVLPTMIATDPSVDSSQNQEEFAPNVTTPVPIV